MATRAAAPAAAPATPRQGGTTGANLMQQYEAAINRGVGQGTQGNPLGDFQSGAQAFWDSSANLRQYGDRLRGEKRSHESNLAGIQASAQVGSAKAQASGQVGSAKAQAGAQKFASSNQLKSDNFSATKALEGIKAQTAGRVQEAGIGARAQVDTAGIGARAQVDTARIGASAQRYGADTDKAIAGIQSGTQKYVADVGLQSDFASFGSNERIASMGQAGENYRSGLQLAGSLLMNKDDNYTQRQGKFFDYMGNVAQSQWRAPDVSNIRYWG